MPRILRRAGKNGSVVSIADTESEVDLVGGQRSITVGMFSGCRPKVSDAAQSERGSLSTGSLSYTRSSSRDEIANVNCFTTTSDTHYKVQ